MSLKTHVFNPLICVVLLASLCSHAQNAYTAADMPQTWLDTPSAANNPALTADWWSSFGDNVLDTLIDVGVANNYDILMAARRVEIARQTLTQARSQFFPTFSLSAGWSGSQSSGATASPVRSSSSSQVWSLGIDMSWQVDIFGKVAAQARGKKANWQASRIEHEGMMVTIEAKIASAYFNLRTLQSRLEVAHKHSASQERILGIAIARYQAGLNSKLDVAQAQTIYLSTIASVPSLENSINAAINALSVLTCIDAAELRTKLATDSLVMPQWERLLAVGVPADLLRRRPDIAQAETVISADAAAIGVAQKDFLPTLTINGSIGTSAHRLGDLFGSHSLDYSVAPTLSWTIFDGMARKATLAQAREQMQADIDNYNLTVLNAVSEVNNALGNYDTALDQIGLYGKVVDQSVEALTLSLDLYTSGLNSFRDVATAQIDYLNYADQLVQSKGSALAALVSLYEALGGGWDASSY